MEAALRGTLTADESGCVRVRSGTSGQYSSTPVWPLGYTVQGGAKSFEVLDAGKNVIARSGAAFIMGGGGIDRFNENWTHRACLNGTKLWAVGTILPG
ncbi:hypothetical protein [Kribbella sp. CA-293567]|uniref:hypothetical protein n=1 Tax=Kribbella sp. CA-293567 TaxID=3002436 RepID=UPI0022DE6621|nr:hypothetical protein [Kribbella sp. CA-293567]WBQ05487.1 hypothetical protein OX958_01500 [Kribbella sp. CA-293567]